MVPEKDTKKNWNQIEKQINRFKEWVQKKKLN